MTFPRALPLAAALLLAALAGPARAQPTGTPAPDSLQTGSEAPGSEATSSPAAVRLDVVRLDVDSLAVSADTVRADFSLDASVGALLSVRAGLTVRIDGAEVAAEGVGAAADLRVHLDTVVQVLLEALEAVQADPTLVRGADRPPAAGASATEPASDGF